MVTSEQLECLRQIAEYYDYGWGQPHGLIHAEQVTRLALKIFDELLRLGLGQAGHRHAGPLGVVGEGTGADEQDYLGHCPVTQDVLVGEV